MKPQKLDSKLLARRRWTEADARAALMASREAGVPLAAFAAAVGLDVQRLHRWQRKLRLAREPALARLVPVDVISRPDTPPVIVRAGALEVEVRELGPATAAWVAQLLGGARDPR